MQADVSGAEWLVCYSCLPLHSCLALLTFGGAPNVPTIMPLYNAHVCMTLIWMVYAGFGSEAWLLPGTTEPK